MWVDDPNSCMYGPSIIEIVFFWIKYFAAIYLGVAIYYYMTGS